MANTKTAAKKTLTVEQYKSPARRNQRQAATLTGLGLKRMNSRSTLEDTPAVRGMIAKVAHMVRIVDETK